ncbi:MAG: vanadium-dependent haloperoxidase [Gammaproteobacteria bacterium]
MPLSRSVAQALRVIAGVSAIVLLSSCGGSSGGDGGNDNAVADQRDPSVARLWNEVTLQGIRNDFARPTIHARNLFHISAAMYDAWAVFDDTASTYLLGNQIENFQCSFDGITQPQGVQSAREEAISYAAYRMIMYRYRLSPKVLDTEDLANGLLNELGYDARNDSLDYSTGSPAALGNYIADCYIRFGLQDGSNERGFFENVAYEPVNPPIDPEKPGNPDIIDLNRWQQISLDLFIDQAGNPIGTDIPFLSPEWGSVIPFALTDDVKRTEMRDGYEYQIYYDPGCPPLTTNGLLEMYQKGFAMVAIWSSHLDPFDDVGGGSQLIDISPRSLGSPDNVISPDGMTGFYPLNFLDNYYRDTCAEDPANGFYCFFDGGDRSTGYDINPATGEPYEEQLVPLGDYTRVLAEFWADGPDSETPPGHWFTIFNEVSDHPELVKSIGGQGTEVGPLEWDIKGYFVMGGAMHDCAISAWGIKGYYDYLRPVSAIRAMADRGQSSDPSLVDSYSPDGLPLYEGFIELVEAGDPLAGAANEHVGKIKVLAWRGPEFIDNPDPQAGVGWILAENWWPYQRPSFVTPPFAGYVSGHSTYSRAAAEVMTAYTGDAYFPGGKSDFFAPANEFLVFEEGPSVDVVLEWATYRDASDQTSLSRIWGGIHPPADDIPGRIIGAQIGPAAYELAESYFNGNN